VARAVRSFFEEDRNQSMVKELIEEGVTLNNPAFQEQEGGPLEGLTFVFTGELDSWTRDEVKRFVEKRKAHATSSVRPNRLRDCRF